MQDPKIKLSVVSYFNSKPFIHALYRSSICNEIDLSLDTPSDCAAKLLDGRVDIGLVPVAIIPELKDARIVSDFCIAADGEVGSVLLLSQSPIEKIKEIYLDYQSRTSIHLIKILAKYLWKIDVKWIQAFPGYEKKIKEETAGLIIGDRALLAQSEFTFSYDLAGEWKKLTSLPFVFACWVANKKIDSEFLSRLNMALSNVHESIEEVVADVQSTLLSPTLSEKYLRENIHYVLDASKKEGLALFLKYLKQMD